MEETRLAPSELVLPLFLKEGLTEPRPISSLPGVVQHSRESLRKAAHEAVSAGVGGLMLFGVPENENKDETGSAGLDPDGILNVGIRDLVAEVGNDTVVMGDLCLDEFTSHGHCGLIRDGEVDNDSTLELLARTAVSHVEAGADAVCPSDMMDGRIGAVRRALDEPLRWIAQNGGENGHVVVAKVREAGDGTGYNAATGEYGDLVSQGVLDPVKVTRSAVRNAASIAGMLLTTETIVADKPAEPEGGDHGHSHGAGGHSHMH